MKSWHLNSQTMPQNFSKIGSHILKFIHFLTLNTPADKNVFTQFGGFSLIGSNM